MHLTKNLLIAALMSLLLVNLALSEESEKRTSLLTKRAGTRPSFSKASTTTTEANYEEEYAEEGEQVENGEQHEEDASATSTTTEPPKKIGPVVRPFRSNEELLQALKKRRLSEKNGKASAITEKPKPAQEDNEPEHEVKTTKAKPTVFAASNNRRFGGHKPTNVKAPVQENQEQTIEEPTSKPFKRSNRFSAKQ